MPGFRRIFLCVKIRSGTPLFHPITKSGIKKVHTFDKKYMDIFELLVHDRRNDDEMKEELTGWQD